MKLTVRKFGDDLAVIPTEEVAQARGGAPGGAVDFVAFGDGAYRLSKTHEDIERHSDDIMERYADTFEALAR